MGRTRRADRRRSVGRRLRGQRRRRGGGWRRPLRTACAVLVLTALLAPPAVLTALRWIPPPTTAFMVWRRLNGPERPALDARWVDWDRIAPDAALAVIAAEDQRFLDHRGFDAASMREAWRDARRGGALRGASTLSQQVSKNLFLWPGRSFFRKGLEAAVTVEIELLWSKRRILEVYLNVAEFGEGVFGVGAASARFFAKAPAALTADEAALLAAVLPNPSVLRVDRPSAYVRSRQSWIRGQMANLRAAGVHRRLEAG